MLDDLHVNDSMTKDVICVNIDKPIKDIVKLLTDKGVSGVVVVDFAGDMVGVISAMDVFKLIEGSSFKEDLGRAEEVMTPFTISISPDGTLLEAANIMLERGVHRLVVTSAPGRKKPVGLLSSTDILREISKGF